MPKQLLAIAAVGILLAGTAKDDEKQKDMDKLQGKWQSAVSIVDGTQRWTSLKINGNVLVYESNRSKGNGGEASFVKFTCELDTSKTPKQIDLTWAEFANKGKIQFGIYKIEDDKLTLCTSQIGKERPKGFEVKEGSGQSLVVLERVKR
jgi:uncharacterized protein (TIGR03067 family)